MALTGYVSGQVIQSVPTKGNMKVDRFTADGTWTVPSGVTYAIAHIRAGGGGIGSSSGAGGNSSVAFASGTITATGGNNSTSTAYTDGRIAGVANSGQGARGVSNRSVGDEGYTALACDGAYIVAGGDVTPAASITVTVGAGGTAGTNGSAGGSGYVWIEYLA